MAYSFGKWHRDGVPSLLQNVVLGSLKAFFQLDHQADVIVDSRKINPILKPIP